MSSPLPSPREQNNPQAEFRQLKDPLIQARMSQELTEFLHTSKATALPSQTTSYCPTHKNFEPIFQFLYYQIDPTHHFDQSMHLEIPPLLRKMEYPYQRTICKSFLTAAGGNSKHWPTFLVLLHWMMELVKGLEEDVGSDYDCDGKIWTCYSVVQLTILT